MQVDVRLLGGFEVAVDGEQVPADAWRRRAAASLVKLLALQPERRMLREQVIDALWPDLLLDEAAPRLHKAAHYARNALGTRDAVVLVGEMVTLLPSAAVSMDVARFDEASAAALRESADDETVSAAVAAYRGDLLPDDVYESWTQETREALRLRYVEVLRRAGHWEEVVALDPVDEVAHVQVMRDHLRHGRRRAVLRQYDRLERVLHDEIGASPGEAATALWEEALRVDVDRSARELHAVRQATPVPVPPTPTVGRSHDIERALETLRRARIVTLLGPGGVGKTRLAIESALRHSEAASVEVCFVDLTKVVDAGHVPELIVREMGVHQTAQATAQDLLREAVRGRALLLVLDNFEHVVDAADVVGDIVGWSPDARVLCTSRARLHVVGEHVVDVDPLPVEIDEAGGVAGLSVVTAPGCAVELFAQVASAADPRFDVARSLDDVVDICRTLDGLPLAIELAAGHIRTLPPPLLRTRLATRLGSPSGARRDAPERQQTISATIDWSLALLGPEEARLFARLGVFAGPVPLEAVEEVCSDASCDVVDVLGRLVDQSLVRRLPGPREGEWRFGLLELLRERARDLLTGDHRDWVEAAHARYVARVLDELDDHRWTLAADRWIDLTTELLPEIRLAHAWAESHGAVDLAARITADLGTFWHREGHHAEGRRWVADSLAHAADLDPDVIARLHLAAGFVEWPRDQRVARRLWERAVEQFRRLGHRRYLAYSLALSSGTYIGERDSYDVAMLLCDESIDLARRVGERPLIAQALNIKGELARVQGDDDTALAVYTEGRDLAGAAHDRAHLSVFLANLSYLADHRQEYDEARRLGCESLRTSWALGRRMMSAWSVSELAGPELGLGRPERGALLVGAADHALEMLGVTRHPGDRPEHERVVAGLRAALGEEAFTRLRAQGAELSLPEAVALALSDAPGTAIPSQRRDRRRSRVPTGV
jgi:predicted ATPase/DNA-binding SARP family transcriptional activator